MITVLFSANPGLWDDYDGPLQAAISTAGVSAQVVLEAEPGDVDYVVFAPGGPVTDFAPYVNVKAVLGLWAGVENIVTNTTLTQPLCRMVDPGLAEGMAEWVTGHILRYHLGLDADVLNTGKWTPRVPPLARQRTVGILGMGALGSSTAEALAHIGFRVKGWARTERPVPGVDMHFGRDGLDRVLELSDFLVLLLPLTTQTENLLGHDTLAKVKRGVFILNPGRGPLIDDDALLQALDDGRVAAATLDVFRQEPLPLDHPYWAHPRVTVTPHIASATRVETAVDVIAENIRRGEMGEPYLHLVDRAAGY